MCSGALNQTSLAQHGHNALSSFLGRDVRSWQHQLRVLWTFIRGIDTREVLQLTPPRLLVETLDIALLGHGQRCVHELVTNNAAAALAFPIALATARAFGVDPTAFVMVVAYGASACFLVPFGYQTHLMVMSPGHYRVTDFFRAGLPVSLSYSVVVLLLTPVFFPLTAV